MNPVSTVRALLAAWLMIATLACLCLPRLAHAQALDCEVSDAPDLAFGDLSYPVAGAEATTDIQIRCTNGAGSRKSVQTCLTVAGSTSRAMRRWWILEPLPYTLSRDSAGSVWDSENQPVCGTVQVPAKGSATHTIRLYGSIDPLTSAPRAGYYAEPFITGTLSYGTNQGNDVQEAFDFAANAWVRGSCTVLSAGELAFGPQPALPVSGSTWMEVICTRGTVFRVRLGQGLHASGGMRRMLLENDSAPPLDYISYELFLDADDRAPCDPVSGPFREEEATGSAQGLMICGRVPAQAQPALRAGTYSDTVTVTVEY